MGNDANYNFQLPKAWIVGKVSLGLTVYLSK